jgi:membrane fusion protein (multidrug efflux system)
MKLFHFLFLLSLPALFAVSCNAKKADAYVAADPKQARKDIPVSVEAFIVKPQTIRESASVPGSLLPFEATELHPEVSGRVVQLNVKEGTQVSKRTLLVKIYDGDLQAQLKKLAAQLATAEKTVERQTALLKINGISQQEVDLSILQVSTIKADMEVIKTSIDKTELRAPFNGRLGLKNISPGAYVTPQTVVTTIRKLDRLKIEFTVPEKYSSRITIGMPVLFSVVSAPHKYHAKVIASESGISEDSRSLRVRAEVTEKDKYLVPGAFAEVNLLFGKNTDALMIPSQAVIPQARFKKVIVYRNGMAAFETVTTGMRDSANVEITSGLRRGDTIVTTGLLSIKPDARIQINKIN